MKFAHTLIALLTTLAATSSQAHANAAPPNTAASAASAQANLPQAPTTGWEPVAVRYRVSFKPASVKTATPAAQDWYFIRQPNMIATLRPDNAEIWRQTEQGLSLERVFHAERHIVDYTPGELRTLGIQPAWQQLASIVDAQMLSQLKPGARRGSLQDFSGEIQGERIRLSWDHAQQLPATLQRVGKLGELKMQRISPKNQQPLQLAHISAKGWPAGWPRSEAGLQDYQRLDAADFGDMDYNPVVRKAEALDVQQGLRKPHAHD